MSLSLDDVHYRQALETGVPYAATKVLGGIPSTVKVLVYDFGTDSIGVTNVKVKGGARTIQDSVLTLRSRPETLRRDGEFPLSRRVTFASALGEQ